MNKKLNYEAPEVDVVKLSMRTGVMINASLTPSTNTSGTLGENVTIEEEAW